MKMFKRGAESKKPLKSASQDNNKNIIPRSTAANKENPFNILQSFIDSSNSPIFSIGSDYCYTSFNKSHASVMKSLYGVDIQLGKSMLDYMTVKADCETARENLDRVLSKGETVIEEAYSGDELLSRRYFEVSHSPIINRAGSIDGVLVTAQDITERKQEEEALIESEDQLRASLENAPDGVYMNDQEGNFLYVNRKCEEISGYQREEVIGKNFLEVNLIPENDLSRAAELFQDTIKGGSTGSVALELIRKDGRRIPIEIRANVVRYKGQAVMLSFVRDISERKRVESALQESEQSYRRLADYHKQLNDISILFIEATDKQNLFDRITESFRLLTDAMGAIFSLYDQQTRDLKVVSVSIDPVYRHKVDFLLGPDLFEMRMPIGADVMEEMLSQGIRRLKDLHELSFGGIPQDISDAAMAATGCQQIIGLAISYASELIGTCAAYLPGSQPVVPDDALKTYAYISGLAVKRKRSEETLQKTENIYRLLAENMTDTLWMMDMDLNITWMSPSSVKARGMSLDEIAAIPPDKQATPESFGRAMILFEKMLRIEREGRNPTSGAAVSMEMEFYSGGGTTRWFDCTFQFIRDKQGKATGILAQGRDITERKRAEETLQKTENIYRLLAENISDTVWMMDMDLNVTWASPSSAKLRGFSLDEILALPLDGQLTPESLGKAVNLWGKWMHVEKKGRTPDPNGSISIELEFICKDGHTVLLDCALQFIRDEKGKATGILAAGRDITERRAAELAREESEKNYRLLAENTADVVTIMDMNLNITWLSSSCEKLTGYTREEQKSLPLEKQMTQESLERALNQFAAELEREKSGTAEPGRYQDMELEIYHKDGHTLWTENRIQFIRDGQGKAVGILMQGRDITERRQAEDALKASEAQYRLLSEHMTDTVWLMDMNLKVTYHSPSGEKLRGLTPQEIMTMPLEQTLTPESLKLASELFFEEIPKVKADPDYNPVRTMELEYYCKDGTTIWAESKFSIIRDSSGKAVSILGEGRDITKRKQVEEALQESETQYRLLSEHTADTVWLMDMNLKPTYQSPSAEKLRGYTPQEVLDLPLEKQITPESLKLALEVFSEEIPKVEADPGYNPVLTLELEYYRKDGTTVWAESTFSLIRDENGKPISILAEARDITERREAERRIRESEILYRSLIETSPDAIGLMDINGTIIMYNKQALEVFGFELTDDLRGKNIMDMVSPEYYKESIKNAEKLQKSEIIRNWEVTSHKKDGRLFWVEISTSMIFDEEGKPKSIMAVFKDITERKLSEEKLAKSIESLKKTFNDAINTMVKIVEMRDPYTAGHQQKVADLSTAIAREMKFGDTRIEQLKMAAVIHDIGKMYVPSDILSKPGKLTNMEFRLVQTHSQCGYDIVKSMDFPSPVAEAVLQHHERLDGSGYPNKLKGEDMLLEAKILAVADVTEAMFSHRPYRPALGIEKALEEISKNKGRLYDPDVVDACLEIFNSGKFEFKSI